ncbi:hypothetical protein [Thiohalocapsa sp. ML1]|jgi:hypothetical protein|uniref:hypothetical protein n=1 Tax=Thiohalocapsa sp. ML1 TaxID=1431688 RepID=UPI0007320394|nr:hypothetical protein [Thiohalocapsa sp. ML1]
MANSSSVSNAIGYHEIGELWDEHDTTDHGDDEAAEFVLKLGGETHYVALERNLHLRLRALDSSEPA